MIGTRIRGLHHLNTIMDGAAPSPILINNGRNFHVGVVYNPTTKFGNKALLFFQNVINNSIDYSDYDTSVVKVMQTIQQTYRHVCCIRDKRFLSQFGSEVILLPSTFTDDYNKFCERRLTYG